VQVLARCARRGGFAHQRALRLARLFLFAAMNGTLDWFQGGAVSLKAVADEMTELVLQGLRQRPSKENPAP